MVLKKVLENKIKNYFFFFVLVVLFCSCEKKNIIRNIQINKNICVGKKDISIVNFSLNTNFKKELFRTNMTILVSISIDEGDDIESFFKAKDIIMKFEGKEYPLEFLEEIQIGGDIRDEILLSFEDLSKKQRLLSFFLNQKNLNLLYNSFESFVNEAEFFYRENGIVIRNICFSNKIESKLTVFGNGTD